MPRSLWTIPFDKVIIRKEVVRRHKRRTKSQAIEEYKKRRNGLMPKLDTEVREGADDVNIGMAYEIVDVEMVKTDVQSLDGIRVSLISVDAEEGNVMLWQRKTTGTLSKLGAYITALGNDTDKWFHQWVVHEPWQLRNNVLSVVPVPAPKASEAKETKTT